MSILDGFGMWNFRWAFRKEVFLRHKGDAEQNDTSNFEKFVENFNDNRVGEKSKVGRGGNYGGYFSDGRQSDSI